MAFPKVLKTTEGDGGEQWVVENYEEMAAAVNAADAPANATAGAPSLEVAAASAVASNGAWNPAAAAPMDAFEGEKAVTDLLENFLHQSGDTTAVCDALVLVAASVSVQKKNGSHSQKWYVLSPPPARGTVTSPASTQTLHKFGRRSLRPTRCATVPRIRRAPQHVSRATQRRTCNLT